MSDFVITIRGPAGVVLDATIDETLRSVRSLAIDDDALKQLLVITSVCAGVVDGELMKRHEARGQSDNQTMRQGEEVAS